MLFEFIPDWKFGVYRIVFLGGDVWLLDRNYNNPGFAQASISFGLYWSASAIVG